MSKMDAVIVDAVNQEGGLSLRRHNGERLSASALKTGLMEAGFKAGDEVVIVTRKEYETLLHVELVARNHGELRCECLGASMDDALFAYEQEMRK